MTHESTNAILEAIEQGLLTGEVVAKMCLSYMSEDDVADMLRANDIDLSQSADDSDDLDVIDDVNYPGHPSHY